MSNYTKTTNFAVKDALVSGNPAKVVKGSEVDIEFNNISTSVATKANLAGPSLTGSTTAVNLTVSGTFSATVDGGTY